MGQKINPNYYWVRDNQNFLLACISCIIGSSTVLIIFQNKHTTNIFLLSILFWNIQSVCARELAKCTFSHKQLLCFIISSWLNISFVSGPVFFLLVFLLFHVIWSQLLSEWASAVRDFWCPDSESLYCSSSGGRCEQPLHLFTGMKMVVKLQVDFSTTTHLSSHSHVAVTPHGRSFQPSMFPLPLNKHTNLPLVSLCLCLWSKTDKTHQEREDQPRTVVFFTQL